MRCESPDREAHWTRDPRVREALADPTSIVRTVSNNKAVEKQGGHQTMHGYAGSPG